MESYSKTRLWERRVFWPLFLVLFFLFCDDFSDLGRFHDDIIDLLLVFLDFIRCRFHERLDEDIEFGVQDVELFLHFVDALVLRVVCSRPFKRRLKRRFVVAERLCATIFLASKAIAAVDGTAAIRLERNLACFVAGRARRTMHLGLIKATVSTETATIATLTPGLFIAKTLPSTLPTASAV